MPIAPASFARAALEANVQKPRDTSAIAPSSECAGRSLTGPLGSLLAPHNWYGEFPVGSGRWISSLGPYDEHLVRDFGSLYLALGLLLAFAGFALDRLLVRAVLWASLVFQVAPRFTPSQVARCPNNAS